jgi:hypothetical protein
MIQFAMVVFEVRDLQRTIAFHRLLGLDVPDPEPDRPVAPYRIRSQGAGKTTGPYAAMVDDPDGNVVLISSDVAAIAPPAA